MSFLKRGLNVLKGKVALLQEQDSAAERQKVKELDKELEQGRPFSTEPPSRARTVLEEVSEPEEAPQKPLTPRDRTI